MVLKNLKLLLKGLKEEEVTRVYPDIAPPVEERWRGLQQLDPLKCIGCGSCVRACPNYAIELVELRYPYKNPKNKKGYPKIDLGVCLFCGLCEEVCPVNALRMGTKCDLAEWTREDLIYPPERLIPGDFEETHREEIEQLRQKMEEKRAQKAEEQPKEVQPKEPPEEQAAKKRAAKQRREEK
ncbi:4Fe-4S binding protein [Methermicoccus shengliensis]|uniref:4Fe-4S binding protein n=1 Tax=Methermicoccus shengliensis TaxID=660064 RepID=A0A832RXQ1_9EURY|nr:4Fe-4S binding protein [Methermicoccus shengliensis]MDI3488709.1 dehydrogenase subunit [Methanosarcinales archaeon]HIH70103.1 4Fe-4S binding protein [Methermicoccus shengliensis]